MSHLKESTMKNSLIKQVLLIIGSITLLFLLGAGVIDYNISSVHHTWEDYQKNVAARQNLISQLKSHFGYGGGIHLFKNYLLRGREDYLTKFAAAYQKVDEAIAEYRKLGQLSQEELQALSVIADTFKQYANAMVLAQKMKQEGKTIVEIDKAVKISDDPALNALEQLNQLYAKLTEQSQETIKTTILNLHLSFFSLTIMMVLLMVLAGWLFHKRVLKPLKLIVFALKELGNGRLGQTVYIKSKDEIGQMAMTVNEVSENLTQITTNILDASDTVLESSSALNSSSNQMQDRTRDISDRSEAISASSEQIGNSITNLASANEEVSANMASITHHMTQISENITNVATSVEEMYSSLSQTNKLTKKAEDISGKAKQSAQATSQAMQRLEDQAGSINRVVNLISDIAGQTRMLALNATIEAASAGETGKGFAVVAAEVKNLAQQTADANEEIAKGIKSIQQFTREALNHTNTMSDHNAEVSEINTAIAHSMESESQTAREVSASVDSIAASGKELSLNINEISITLKENARTSSELSSGINGVNQNIHNIKSTITEASVAMSENLKKTKDLNQTADSLRELISFFQLPESPQHSTYTAATHSDSKDLVLK